MNRDRQIGALLGSLVLLCSAHAHAHFKLLKPASWLNEDELGGPQKGSPCGPGNSMIIIGDDVQPVPESNAVTTYQAGEKVMVGLQETVYHPGYYRISFAPTTAAKATTQDFPDPALTDPKDCYYDKSAVKTAPHENVLADGLWMASEVSAPGRTLMQEVTLPNQPCEECTMQIVQVMEGHGGSSCFYFHCADIRIVAAEGGAAGHAGAGHAGAGGDHGSHQAAGTSAPTPQNDVVEETSCSIANAGARGSDWAAWAALGIFAVWGLRRRRRSAR